MIQIRQSPAAKFSTPALTSKIYKLHLVKFYSSRLHIMTIANPASFKLLDGTSIPWIAWGNGTGQAKVKALECGQIALASGIHHLDTAQLYHTEKETGDAIKSLGLKRDNVYVTSKRT